MRKNYTAIISCFLLLLFAGEVFGQQPLVSDFKKRELDDFAAQLNDIYVNGHQKALNLAQSHGWTIRRKTKNGGLISLQGINSLGFPVYLITHNLTSAQTTNTTTVWPGGPLGLNLSGSSSFLDGRLAIWDGGSVYTGHQEFAGKTITLKDDTTPALDHSTHVAGTMIAKGIDPDAKGMAFNAATLISYNFDNDVGKMSSAAAGLLLSNHSYGDEAGWDYNNGIWTWYGLPGDSVDYTFGFYGDRTQAFDQIAYKAPYYLIVESAGNAQTLNGPPVGSDYYGYKSRTNQTIVDKGKRLKDSISDNSGYQNISSTGNAKNILTVGAVGSLPNGPQNSQEITIAPFSSYGPTNDGRIKPDIVGMGLYVLSTGAGSPRSYLIESGTSMSSPNVTGSLYLLQEYYAQQNHKFMHAATLKGLACGTAFDAGNVGPDYIYGWGLLDMKNAAQAITDNGTKSLVKEATLQQSQIQTYSVIASGAGPLKATISWTDPAAPATADGIIDDPTIKLVNDLDVRVSDGSATFKPWVLDPAKPNAPATTGDNIRDNMEQVYIPGAVAGKTYTITVKNKGYLQSGAQDYSLIVTGAQTILPQPVNNSANINLLIYPVPASRQLSVAFNINTGDALNLSLINSAGKIVYSNQRHLNAGSFSVNIDVSSQAAGIYAVKMLLGQKLYTRKIIIIK